MDKRLAVNALIAALIIFATCICTFPQSSTYKDRLGAVRDLVNSNELIMIWNQGETFGSQFCYQRIYDLNLTQPGGVDSTLIKKPLNIDSSIVGNRRLAVATGNFLGGSFKHFVAAWEGPNNSITISIPEIQAGTLSWDNSNRLSVSGLASFGKRKIHVETGNFLGNSQEEFLLAYEGMDTTVHLQLFSFNPGSLAPQERGSINDEKTLPSGSSLDNWDIVAGDFDSDGYDDIALLFVKPMGGTNWSLFVKIYSINENGEFIPKSSKEVFQKPTYSVLDINIDGAAGNFNADAGPEIAFGFSFFQGEEPGNDTYVYLIDVKNNLTSIIVDDTRRVTRDVVGPNEMPQFNVGAGDLNGDYRDELILMSGSTFYVYTTDDQLLPQFRSQKSVLSVGNNFNSDEFLAVEDMDLDRSSEIVVAKSFEDNEPGGLQHFELHVFSLDSTLINYTLKAKRINEEPILSNNGSRNYAIALGDFDGDRIRLGDPVHYRKTGVMQPTVVLYTPPIHYDIFDNTSYDLSGCYPDQNCGFFSTYIQSTTVDTTITTEINEDWGIDESLYIQLPMASLRTKASYGDKFSRRESTSNSYTITTGRTAAGDDWIYANVFDIDFYEYPVYDSLNTTPIGHFLVSIPGNRRPLWIEGKDDGVLGNLFRPNHEVGNILSYSTESAADTSRTIVNFNEQTIGNTGTSHESLLLSTFQTNNIESSWNAGLEVGVTVGQIGSIGVGEFVSYSFPVGAEVGVTGRYDYGEIYTQTVNVGHSLEVRSDFGHLQPQFGTSGTYYVTPYAYWTSFGALALDYKVSPLPMGGNSFWQERYGGKPDLTFNLPWRYDTEKGFPMPGNDSTYRQRSRDIFLSKVEPHGGDTVLIAARVRNYGLQSISTPFSVRFYTGDPNSGGAQIAETIVDSTIDARGSINVVVPWTIPLSLPLANLRIYAVIDPDNSVTNEVHENNNIGWAPVIGYGSITNVESEIIIPDKFVLHQAYPNPFNPTATISFELPTSENVSLKVFNTLGEEVETLVDEFQTAGKHNVKFNGSRLASGVYFYRLQAGSFVQTQKMILLK
ncbi:MAG TPA: T9SS type A sorting domain-containing protein [Ignavibacteriaceae bacterium]